MMDEVATKRAAKHGDSRMWSCEDALEDALNNIRNGKDNPSKIVIHFIEENTEGHWLHWYSVAGVTISEHFAILELAKTKLMDWWRGK